MIHAPDATHVRDLRADCWHVVGRESSTTMEWQYCCMGWVWNPDRVVTVQRRVPGGYELLAKLPKYHATKRW